MKQGTTKPKKYRNKIGMIHMYMYLSNKRKLLLKTLMDWPSVLKGTYKKITKLPYAALHG